MAVLRRGPSRWSHVGRWDVAADRYEPGAWLRGRIFPRRSDLSPDGRFLCVFAHKPNAQWEEGETYVAISRLPWLTALHAFGTCGTWTRGYHFSDDPAAERIEGAPFRYGVAPTRPEQFACERRRGWVEAPDSPPRAEGDLFDSRRNARLVKPAPDGARVLHVESVGSAGGEFGVDQAVDGLRVVYSIEAGGDLQVLDELQWADWDATGHLLVATREGRIERRRLDAGGAEVVFSADLAALSPDPQPAPDWAGRW